MQSRIFKYKGGSYIADFDQAGRVVSVHEYDEFRQRPGVRLVRGDAAHSFALKLYSKEGT